MTLNSRLTRAREDYRDIPVHDPRVLDPIKFNEAVTGRSNADPPHRNNRPLVVAAAVVVLMVGMGFAYQPWSDDGASVRTRPTSEGAATVGSSADDSVVAVSDSIRLEPAGPYTDGQSITVSVSGEQISGYVNVRECAVLTHTKGSPREFCSDLPLVHSPIITATTPNGGTGDPGDPVAPGDPAEGLTSWLSGTVSVTRTMFTPLGARDCNDKSITCRLILTDAEGNDHASQALRFEGKAPVSAISLEISPAGASGEVLLTLTGAVTDSGWLREYGAIANRPRDAFRLSICAFETSEEFTEESGWPANKYYKPKRWPQEIPDINCRPLNGSSSIDPRDPTAPVRAHIPTWFAGLEGWSDCRVDTCFIAVDAMGGGPGDDGSIVRLTNELIPLHLIDKAGTRPRISVLSDGPHGPGQDVRIELNGMGARDTTQVMLCSDQDGMWECTSMDSASDNLTNGTHTITLPSLNWKCVTDCYLEAMETGPSVGIMPIAFTPIDTGP